MFKVIVLKSIERKEIMATGDRTIVDIWEEAFGYSNEMIMINGSKVSDIQKSLNECGLDPDREVYMSCFAKIDNAAF